MKKLLICCVLFAACKNPGIPVNPEISPDDLKSYVSTLADDKMEGRGAGTEFEDATARYVEACFKKYGLKPLGDSYFQTFDFISGVIIGDESEIHFYSGDEVSSYQDGFTVLPFSFSGRVIGDLVFAGYGISAPDLGYDDYENLDVEGKVVMVMRYSPDGKERDGDFSPYSALRYKAITAREKGATTIIFITGPEEDNNQDKLLSPRSGGGKQDVGIPAIHLKRNIADRWLKNAGKETLEELQKSINGEGHPKPASFALGSQLAIVTDVIPEKRTSRNVIGVIEGAGSLKDQWLILGAHMDHLGWGGEGSNSMVPDVYEIHNGADDNASGTSALLELANHYADAPLPENRRSLLFIAFGAEEVGLLGSAHYTEEPLIPLENTVAMFNMDMVGRLRDNSLVVGGSGTSSLWEKLLTEVNTDSIKITFDEEGFGASDHQSFYLKDIPVLFFFTGAHEDYHRPSDDVELLNFDGLAKVTELVDRSVEYILTADEKPDFVEVKTKKRSGGRGYSITFGVIPDFIYDGEGMKISGVRDEAPAGKAGMQGGDIIVEINHIRIRDIHDYMFALQSCTAGVEVPVVIERGDETITLNIAPQGRD